MTNQCVHEWIVVEESRSINEYTGLENGIQRCRNCHDWAHFTRDPDPKPYPHLLTMENDHV